jgi:hypothetical protein
MIFKHYRSQTPEERCLNCEFVEYSPEPIWICYHPFITKETRSSYENSVDTNGVCDYFEKKKG